MRPTLPLLLAVLLASCSKAEPTPAPTGATTTPAASASGASAATAPKDLAVGAEAYAYDRVLLGQSADLMVYPTEKLFDAWENSVAAQNSAESQRIVPQVSSVPPGGKVMILAIGKPTKTFSTEREAWEMAPRAKVRILSGEDRGKDGFIALKDLHVSPLPAR